MGKRTTNELRIDILECCKEPKTIPILMVNMGMNYQYTKRHIEYLLNKKLIEPVVMELKLYLRTTKKGYDAVKEWKEFMGEYF